jgi:hypothetical protein
VNHAIVIKYSSGSTLHAPPHKDKLPPNTGFFVFSFGEPRRFQFLGEPTGKKLVSKVAGAKKAKVEVPVHSNADVVWDHALPSNSLLAVSAGANESLYHAVPKDKTWSGGARYSLIFRTIVQRV